VIELRARRIIRNEKNEGRRELTPSVVDRESRLLCSGEIGGIVVGQAAERTRGCKKRVSAPQFTEINYHGIRDGVDEI
jgi:hypothetical protein